MQGEGTEEGKEGGEEEEEEEEGEIGKLEQSQMVQDFYDKLADLELIKEMRYMLRVLHLYSTCTCISYTVMHVQQTKCFTFRFE